MQLRLNELQGKASWMTATDAGGMPASLWNKRHTTCTMTATDAGGMPAGRYSITNAWQHER
jgi:hypothetical protein